MAFASFVTMAFAQEIANVQIRNDQIVECAEGSCFDWETATVIRSQATFDLNANLSRHLSWIGVNANEIVALVVRGRFVREDVPSHQVPHNEIFSAQGDHRIPRELRSRFVR